MNQRILKHHLKVLLRQVPATLQSLVPSKPLAKYPSVTLFISSLNTRYPLELTLESLTKQTRYPNYKIIVGENSSTDGSVEYLESVKDRFNITINAAGRRKHAEWINEIFRTVDTDYWCAVDSDMVFLGRDWLLDLITIMEADPDLQILSGEERPARPDIVEPINGIPTRVDLGENPSTWLFCVRTALRDKIESGFDFAVEGIDPATGRTEAYDVGGRILKEMREKNLKYAHMSKWYQSKYYHYGSFSWTYDEKIKDDYQAFKQYQLAEMKQRIAKLKGTAKKQIELPTNG